MYKSSKKFKRVWFSFKLHCTFCTKRNKKIRDIEEDITTAKDMSNENKQTEDVEDLNSTSRDR